MSDSVRPHRRQPTRLPSPWDSPGKNTGVGCHFLLQRMKLKSESEVGRVRPSATPWTAAFQAPTSMGFSRQEYWSGCHCLLQPANAGDIKDTGSVPGLGRSPGGGHDNPLQYCLENSMDRGAWRATVYSVTKSRTRLKGARTHLRNSRSLASLTTLSPHSLMSALSWNCPSIDWSLTIYTLNEVKAHPAPHSQDSYLLPLSPGCV